MFLSVCTMSVLAPLSVLRQVEERQMDSRIQLMAWSPKSDLLAAANKQGEVVLYRMNWQKVINRETERAQVPLEIETFEACEL